jgi:GNAT superfamily N-acetyltransferase
LEQTTQDRDLSFRTLDGSDLVAVQRLVRGCPPLTLHTPYTYSVMLGRSSGLCIGALLADRLVGVALAIPGSGGRAFLWQLGVLRPQRGRGLGVSLLRNLWDTARGAGMGSLETTIDPRNTASLSTFRRFALEADLDLHRAGELIVRDAEGREVEREVEYRLQPRRGGSAPTPASAP